MSVDNVKKIKIKKKLLLLDQCGIAFPPHTPVGFVQKKKHTVD